jgi:hypothetical protein
MYTNTYPELYLDQEAIPLSYDQDDIQVVRNIIQIFENIENETNLVIIERNKNLQNLFQIVHIATITDNKLRKKSAFINQDENNLRHNFDILKLKKICVQWMKYSGRVKFKHQIWGPILQRPMEEWTLTPNT